jgi:hypothetical protein
MMVLNKMRIWGIVQQAVFDLLTIYKQYEPTRESKQKENWTRWKKGRIHYIDTFFNY